MKAITLSMFLVVLLACQSSGQQEVAQVVQVKNHTNQPSENMKKAVTTALESYLTAGDQNDVATLEAFMHPDFRVTLFDGSEGIVKIVDRATYASLIGNKTFGGYPRTPEYHAVQTIGGHMATVQVTLTSPGKPSLKNFYSMVKQDGKWQVVQDFVTMVP